MLTAKQRVRNNQLGNVEIQITVANRFQHNRNFKTITSCFTDIQNGLMQKQLLPKIFLTTMPDLYDESQRCQKKNVQLHRRADPCLLPILWTHDLSVNACHAEDLSWTLSVPTLVSTAQAIFLSEHRQTDTQRRRHTGATDSLIYTRVITAKCKIDALYSCCNEKKLIKNYGAPSVIKLGSNISKWHDLFQWKSPRRPPPTQYTIYSHCPLQLPSARACGQ